MTESVLNLAYTTIRGSKFYRLIERLNCLYPGENLSAPVTIDRANIRWGPALERVGLRALVVPPPKFSCGGRVILFGVWVCCGFRHACACSVEVVRTGGHQNIKTPPVCRFSARLATFWESCCSMHPWANFSPSAPPSWACVASLFWHPY